MRQEIPQNDARPFGFALAAGLFAATIAYGVFAALSSGGEWLALAAFGIVGMWVLGQRIRAHDERGWRIVETWKGANEPRPAQQVVYASPGEKWVFVEIGGRGQYIWQPAAGALARFISDAISVQSRIQFSQRQALERGWTQEQYAAMVAQLKAERVLSNRVINGAPDFEQTYLPEVREWLAMEADFPHPPTPGYGAAQVVRPE